MGNRFTVNRNSTLKAKWWNLKGMASHTFDKFLYMMTPKWLGSEVLLFFQFIEIVISTPKVESRMVPHTFEIFLEFRTPKRLRSEMCFFRVDPQFLFTYFK